MFRKRECKGRGPLPGVLSLSQEPGARRWFGGVGGEDGVEDWSNVSRGEG